MKCTLDTYQQDGAFETYSMEEVLKEEENQTEFIAVATATQPEMGNHDSYVDLFERMKSAVNAQDVSNVSLSAENDDSVGIATKEKNSEPPAGSSAAAESKPTTADEKLEFVNGLYSLYGIDPALTEKMELELGTWILSALKSNYKILLWEDVVEKMKKDYKEIAENKHEVIANKVLLELRLSDLVVLRYYPKIKKVVIGFESWLRKNIHDKTDAFCKPYLRVTFPQYVHSAGFIAKNRYTTWQTRI